MQSRPQPGCFFPSKFNPLESGVNCRRPCGRSWRFSGPCYFFLSPQDSWQVLFPFGLRTGDSNPLCWALTSCGSSEPRSSRSAGQLCSTLLLALPFREWVRLLRYCRPSIWWLPACTAMFAIQCMWGWWRQFSVRVCCSVTGRRLLTAYWSGLHFTSLFSFTRSPRCAGRSAKNMKPSARTFGVGSRGCGRRESGKNQGDAVLASSTSFALSTPALDVEERG